MLTITDAAFTRLSTILEDLPDHSAARIVQKGEHMKLRRSKPRPGDEAVDYKGRTVLVVGERTLEQLHNRILDVRETKNGPKLRLRRGPRTK